MEQLHPTHVAEVDAYEAHRPPSGTASWLRVNMVSSLDGHIVDDDGVSGGLGGDADRSAFFALRHHADAILAGAGTVRAENYGGMRVRDSMRAAREADGRVDPAPIVVVTASLDLDPTSRLFTDTRVPPIVLTTIDADAGAVERLSGAGARIVRAGEGRVDLTAGLAVLRDALGLNHVLCEGGPGLNAALLAADLVDELCLTLAPAIVGSDDPRRIAGEAHPARGMTLTRVLHQDGELLLRYTRQR
ncbi:dihydrofolate reductase family protein [Euzebya pacifica]|uniref:dihydrofolate reductase family protein n=1 Tax=Euzebya pacifica TaxID=1608957 RepID=UPI0030F7F90B